MIDSHPTWSVRPATEGDIAGWYAMRTVLWPDSDTAEDKLDMKSALRDDQQLIVVAQATEGQLIGFLEAGLRRYADGCSTSPVGYIEGWFVCDAWRRHGVGGALVRAAESWAKGQGCTEMASDCLLENSTSLAAHQSLGYEEVERLIHFRKALV